MRELRASDLSAWVELRRRLWPNEPPDELATDAREYLNSAKDGMYRRASMAATVLVAEDRGGSLVGFAEVDLRPFADGCRNSPVGYLEGWYVSPSHRGRGVGRALVRAAEDWARSRGCSEMGSDTEVENSGSRAAHQALDYSEVERLVHFRKDIASQPTPDE